jgi:hypothetical protein
MLCMLLPSPLDGGSISWHLSRLLTPSQAGRGMAGSVHLERLLGLGAVLLGGIAIIVCVCAGWYLAWASSLRDIQFFQELLGGGQRRKVKSGPTAAELQAEIAAIKAAHRRGGASGLYARSERRPSREENGHRRHGREANGRRPTQEQHDARAREGSGSPHSRHPDAGGPSTIQE